MADKLNIFRKVDRKNTNAVKRKTQKRFQNIMRKKRTSNLTRRRQLQKIQNIAKNVVQNSNNRMNLNDDTVIIQNYKKALHFLKKFVKVYDEDYENDRVQIFGQFLVADMDEFLLHFSKEYGVVINRNEILKHMNTTNILNIATQHGYEYLDELLDELEDAEIEDNEDELSLMFMIEFSEVIKQVIRKYIHELKEKQNTNKNMDELAELLGSMKVKNTNKNMRQTESLPFNFINAFSKMGF